MASRYTGEVPGKVPARDELPGTLKRSGAEPPARQPRVVLLLRRVDEEVIVGVRHLENVGAGDRRQRRLALEHDELGRGRAHVPGRGGSCLLEEIDLVALTG